MNTKPTLKRNCKVANSMQDNIIPTKLRKKDINLITLTKNQLIEKVQNLDKELAGLRAKLQKIEDDSKEKLENKSLGTQTIIVVEEFPFPCQICIYNADNELDLRVHMYHAHDLDDGIFTPKVKCKICEKKFPSKTDLMVHIKTKHENTLPPCKNYQNNSCRYNKRSCWFPHQKNDFLELKCRYCSDKFMSKKDVMNHQKNKHIDKISLCKNHEKGICEYKNKCWFKHKEQVEDISMTENSEMENSENEEEQ